MKQVSDNNSILEQRSVYFVSEFASLMLFIECIDTNRSSKIDDTISI